VALAKTTMLPVGCQSEANGTRTFTKRSGWCYSGLLLPETIIGDISAPLPKAQLNKFEYCIQYTGAGILGTFYDKSGATKKHSSGIAA
jgi:hypothetical protein